MSKIPVYQRQNLASSVVCKPGVDTSGQQRVSSIADSYASVANSAFKVAAQRQESIDKIELSALRTEAVVASQQVYNQHQKENVLSPAGKNDVLKEKLDTVFNGIAEKSSNPRIKSAFLVESNQVKGSTLVKETEWAYTQTNTNTKNSLTTSNNTLATQANLVGMSVGSLEGKLQAHRELIATAQKNLEIAQAAGFDTSDFGVKSFQNINGGFIAGLIESDPGLAAQLLDQPDAFYIKDAQGNPVDALGLKEREGYKDAAKKKFEGAVAEADYQNKIAAAQAHGDVYGRIVSGDATLAEINSLETDASGPEEIKHVKALRDIYLERKPFDVKTDSSAYLQFKLKYDKIQADLKKDKRITNPIEQVINFDREITDAVAQRFITQEEGKSLRDLMVTPVYEKAKETHRGGFFGIGQDAWHVGYEAIDSQLDRDKTLTGVAKEQRKYEVLSRFVSEFNTLPNKTETTAKQLAQKIIESNAIRNNPELGSLPATPNSIMTKNGQVTNVLAGASKLAVEQKVSAPGTLRYSKSTGKWSRVYEDGHVEFVEAPK